MKYLALVDSFHLDSAYNIFIPDLRNSGKSAKAKTLMGYKFGEDVAASLIMLNQHYDQDTMFLYGFSMGAMAIANVVGRPELKSMIEEKDIHIEKIILDSPLANVKETLREQTSSVPLSNIYFDRIFDLYSNQIDGFGDKMRLSKLLPRNIPTLVLQSKDDHLTLVKNLDTEIYAMKDFHQLKVSYFDGPDHVRIFQDTTTRVKYLQSVQAFIKAE
jgi:pimeloyl-ACP methyl ester carboxylesterase